MKTTLYDLGRDDGDFRREVVMGIVLGFLALVAIGVTLSVVDPYLRGSGSPLFSLSAPSEPS